VDSERALVTEFRQALDDVLPPAPWLPSTVKEKLRQNRRKGSWSMGALRSVIDVRLPRFSQKVAAAVLVVVLAAAAVGVFLTAHRLASPSVPAGHATPQAMPSQTRDLKAGTYVWDALGKPFPKASITVPDGWTINSGFALVSRSDTPRQLVVYIWDVVDVYANGCQWLGPLIHPGPTADELAAVLVTRPLRNATTPVAVSLGGYNGKYLEWSVPVDIKFNEALADRGFSDCNGGLFKSWTDLSGDRYQQAPGQVDRLWILDVQGRRLVIDASYKPGATHQDLVEEANVVNSIEFRP
jgi:hypothetical protein